jgi:hypothetical protein
MKYFILRTTLENNFMGHMMLNSINLSWILSREKAFTQSNVMSQSLFVLTHLQVKLPSLSMLLPIH